MTLKSEKRHRVALAGCTDAVIAATSIAFFISSIVPIVLRVRRSIGEGSILECSKLFVHAPDHEIRRS